MLERYQEEGEYIPEEEEEPTNLQEIIAVRAITAKASAPIESHPSPLVRFLGNLYNKIKSLADTIASRLVKTRVLRKLDFELYSANISLTASQYMGISVTLALIIGIVTTILMPIVAPNLLGILSAPLIGVLAFFATLFLAISYPSRRANARGAEMEKELPFALRHLAVVIRSGMSLYKAMESIAASNYGILSEEFRRTLKEISEGKTTEEALEALSLRSHSKGVKRAVSQIMRALRIGGSLSEAIRRIAEDVAFEQRNRVVTFTEKLNLVGVVFMYTAVVFPTMLAILNAIGNAPMGTNLLSAFAMPPQTLFLLYVVGIPAFLVIMLLFIRKADPLGG